MDPAAYSDIARGSWTAGTYPDPYTSFLGFLTIEYLDPIDMAAYTLGSGFVLFDII